MSSDDTIIRILKINGLTYKSPQEVFEKPISVYIKPLEESDAPRWFKSDGISKALIGNEFWTTIKCVTRYDFSQIRIQLNGPGWAHLSLTLFIDKNKSFLTVKLLKKVNEPEEFKLEGFEPEDAEELEYPFWYELKML